MMDVKKECLIITATITPNSNYVVNTDSLKRRREYLDVLTYYSNIFSDAIYFVENSEFDFSKDQDFITLFNQAHVNVISLPKSTEFDKGKGYQEFEVLDNVVARLHEKYEAFIKVSGRYLTTNFTKLIQQNNQGIVIDRHQKKEVAITAFFKCRMDFYQENLKNCYQKVNDSKGVFIEHLIYKKLKEVDNRKIDIFTETPIYKGISGSYGGSLNRHPLKTIFINIERKMLKLTGGNELKKEFK
tara:strand:+ start:7546 stop:8274 length:729 start_codon:yes stop_codon:yes gene_type:complete